MHQTCNTQWISRNEAQPTEVRLGKYLNSEYYLTEGRQSTKWKGSLKTWSRSTGFGINLWSSRREQVTSRRLVLLSTRPDREVRGVRTLYSACDRCRRSEFGWPWTWCSWESCSRMGRGRSRVQRWRDRGKHVKLSDSMLPSSWGNDILVHIIADILFLTFRPMLKMSCSKVTVTTFHS